MIQLVQLYHSGRWWKKKKKKAKNYLFVNILPPRLWFLNQPNQLLLCFFTSIDTGVMISFSSFSGKRWLPACTFGSVVTARNCEISANSFCGFFYWLFLLIAFIVCSPSAKTTFSFPPANVCSALRHLADLTDLPGKPQKLPARTQPSGMGKAQKTLPSCHTPYNPSGQHQQPHQLHTGQVFLLPTEEAGVRELLPCAGCYAPSMGTENDSGEQGTAWTNGSYHTHCSFGSN